MMVRTCTIPQMFSVIVLCVLTFTSVIAQLAGPYDFYLTDIGPCKDTGTNQLIVDVKLGKQVKNSIHLSGTVHLPAPYGWSDKIIVTGRVQKKEKNGRGKEIFAKSLGGTCSAFKTYAPDVAGLIAKAFGFNSCPVKPGNYSLDGEVPASVSGIPVFVYGKYSIDLEVSDAKSLKRIGCFYLVCDFVPKKVSKRRG